MHSNTVSFFCYTALVTLAIAAPVAQSENTENTITTPIGLNVDLAPVVEGLGDISPIEDGWLEGDNDSGGETETGGDANSVANGLLGQVGVGSAAFNNGSTSSSSSACSLLSGCVSSSGSSNGNSTSASSTSSSLIGAPLVTVGNIGGKLLRLLRLR